MPADSTNTAFPTALDHLPTIAASDSEQDTPGVEHDVIHDKVNGALNALQALIGVTGSADLGTLIGKLGALASGKLDASQVGAASGVAPLDAGSKVPAAYLPSYVDDVIEVDDEASLPGTGEKGKIYITIDTDVQYRWSGTVYVQLVSSPGTTDDVPEGTTNHYFQEAPTDGATYGRKDSAWIPVEGGGGQFPAFSFTADTASQLDSDPGVGKLRWDDSTQDVATHLFINDNARADLSAFYASLPAAGFVHVVKATDAAVFHVFKWTSIMDGTGYRKFAVTYQSGDGSFSNDDALRVLFLPNAAASGLPIGGATGQVLTKLSATDGDAAWQTSSGGGGVGYRYVYTEPAFSKVVALLPFDGANDSTTITDYAPTNSWTCSGNAKLKTAVKAFGTASLYVPAGANSGIHTATHSGWDFGSGDFTIQFRLQNIGGPDISARLFQTRNGDIYAGISFARVSTSTLSLHMSSTGSSFNLISDAAAATTLLTGFNDVVLQRRGSTVELFVNGLLQKSWGVSGALYYNSADSVIIGGQFSGASRSVNCYIDEFRAVKGEAVMAFSGDYRVVTSAFPTS